MSEGDDFFDLCIIGGGINGTGIARDAAGRGLSVVLLEARDLAAGTSSASTKLIHGGLRYLEYLEFKLVRESLKEREVLLSMAPFIIRPLEIVLPHERGQRPYWMIRLGLWLYDHLGGRKNLPRSKGFATADHEFGAPLAHHFKKAFVFADCWADDSRLVVLNAKSAAEKGARIMTHTPCTALQEEGNLWRIESGDKVCKARMVVNAAGPWVSRLLAETGLDAPAVPKIRMVKGSHIVVKRRYEGEQAYMLQQRDGRIVFVIPYEGNFTLIGTTEEDYQGDPGQVGISPAEIDYLCQAYSTAFRDSLTEDDLEWAYSGVRPLFDHGTEDAKAVSRDYRIYKHENCTLPLISVFGGKLTTYRKLAENVVNMLCKEPAWTAGVKLPGGDFNHFPSFLERQQAFYPWLPPELCHRYARSYGTCMDKFLKRKTSLTDMGTHYGDYVYEAEIAYMIRYEWARGIEDILWRRSKLGLRINDETLHLLKEALPALLEAYRP